MDCCSRAGDKPLESLWVRIRGQTNIHSVVVGVCYRRPDQEEEAEEVVFKQLKKGSQVHVLVLMGDFYHIDNCWKGNKTGSKPPRGFLESIQDHFLLEMINELTSRNTLLNLLSTNKEEPAEM